MKGKERTIDKLLEYNFTTKELNGLLIGEIINGCGGKGGINFSKNIRKALKVLDGFDKNKAKALFNDIERICNEHDFDYFAQKGFRISNYKFAKKLFYLIGSWTTFWQRLGIAILVYRLLNKHGKPYYNFRNI